MVKIYLIGTLILRFVELTVDSLTNPEPCNSLSEQV